MYNHQNRPEDHKINFFVFMIKNPSRYIIINMQRVTASRTVVLLFFICYIFVMCFLQMQVIANYDFRPQDAEELELSRGDIITVTDRSDCNWWQGEIMRNNRMQRGVFPATYVSTYTG